MMAEGLLTARLLADATVSAMVGGRIYVAGKAPQGAPPPYLTYQRIGATQDQATTELDGTPGLDRITVQINCVAASFGANVMAVAQAVRGALCAESNDGAVVRCEPPADLPSEEKLKYDGARLTAVVTMVEAAAAA